MTKLKKNIIYNIVYQLLNLFLPLITIPYISRNLGVSSNGIYSYTYSIVNYFMIFGMLGISNYGNRRIAKVRDDKDKLSVEFMSIYGLQIFLTACSMIIYIIYCIFWSQYIIISIIEIFFLLSTLLDISWFYFGLEEFKKTVTRNIIIKIVSFLLIVMFVKHSSDLNIYTFIMSVSAFGSQLILWVGIKKYVSISIKNIDIKKILSHLKGSLILFIPVISYSIYKIMDKIMIGALYSIDEVAFYEYSEKIINIPIGFITAIGTVMLPKISNLVEKNESDKIKEYLHKSLVIICFITIPCCLGLMAVSDDFSILFLGKNYVRTGIITQYLTVTVFFTAWANVVRTQWLIPTEKDNIYIGTTIFGAIVNFIINIFLIPKYGGIGASVGTICSEFLIMFLQSYFSRREISFYKIFIPVCRFFLTSILMFIEIIFLGTYIDIPVFRIIVQVFVGICTYSLLNIKFMFTTLKTYEKDK